MRNEIEDENTDNQAILPLFKSNRRDIGARYPLTADPREDDRIVQDHPADAAEYKVNLPCFVEPLSTGLRVADFKLLRDARATEIPIIPVLEEVFRKFSHHVYWQVPVVDLVQLSELLRRGHLGGTKISLLLLHAITYATIPHLSMEILAEVGYETHEAAANGLRKKTSASPFISSCSERYLLMCCSGLVSAELRNRRSGCSFLPLTLSSWLWKSATCR